MNVKIDIEDLYAILERTPASHNILLTGAHGVGKSEILTAYYREKGMRVVPLFLGQMSDPGDLIGLPDKDGESTVFRLPFWFPLDGQPIVLFLDELNRARPEVLQTIMDLTLNRRLAGRELPAGSRVIAAANEGVEYQLTELDPALVSRFNIFHFQPTVSDWLLWAKKKDLDYRVVSFIRDNSEWLDGNPQAKVGVDHGLDKTPDRRAWERVSHVIKGVRKLGNLEIKLLSGIVGVKAANIFASKVSSAKMVDVQDVLYRFSETVPSFASFKPHDFQVVSEDIYQYLSSLTIPEGDEAVIAKSIREYLSYLDIYNKREAYASFANLFQQDKYERAVSFMMQHCSDVAIKLMSYSSKLR